MAGSVKVGGAWKTVSGASVKVGGAWKTVSAGYTKVGGAWKQWYSSAIEPMELIQTIIVPSNSSADIVFSSIPSTYQHLQLRIAMQATAASSGTTGIRFNGDTANYTVHTYSGTDGTPSSTAPLGTNRIYLPGTGDKQTGAIVDIYDYAKTNKTKTLRVFGGSMHIGTSPLVRISSGLWNSTAAINSVTLTTNTMPLAAGSRFSLYGIKGQ